MKKRSIAAWLLLSVLIPPTLRGEEKKSEEKAEEKKSAEAAPALDLSNPRNAEYRKTNDEVFDLYRPVVASGRACTAQVFTRAWNRRVAMAVVVSEKGYLITKLSEVETKKDLEVAFAATDAFPNLRLGAKVVSEYRPYDLALLKVDGSGFKPVKWHVGPSPAPGALVAAVGLKETPIAIGVVSVEPRSLDDANKGFLGVAVERSDTGLRIRNITEKSAAADAGLALNDIVVTINGNAVSTREDFVRTIGKCKPTEKVTLRIRRGTEEKDIDAILRRRGDFKDAMRNFEDPRNSIGTALSATRTGFPAALQHDLYLKPYECGGPLVDLDGKVIGVNIARSGRIESLAIPSATMIELLKQVDEGHFYHPELDELKKSRENIAQELKRLSEIEGRFKQQLEDIDKKLTDILGKPAEAAASAAK